MKHVLIRFSAVCVATLFFAGVNGRLQAQVAPETSSASSRPAASPEDLSQAELLKAYLQLRDQLHTTQLAIASSRAEAEATSRAQAAALAEKMESIKATLAAERDRQQAERERQQAERERQQAEMQRTNERVLWIAGVFGGVGLLALFLMPMYQMRAIHRITELAAIRPQLPAPNPHAALLPSETAALTPSDQAVTGSSQRLISALNRMEQRIMELEATASAPIKTPKAEPPPSAAPTSHATISMVAVSPTAKTVNEPPVPPAPSPAPVQASAPVATPPARTAADDDQAAWIAVLLNKARTLLAANKPLDAIACYDEILKLNRCEPDALVQRGAALERLNRFEEAIECYDRAIKYTDKITLAYLHKAAACNRAGRYQDAVECFEQALQLEEKETKSSTPA
jgi:tetratricopeptide (TPR) repeat protein